MVTEADCFCRAARRTVFRVEVDDEQFAFAADKLNVFPLVAGSSKVWYRRIRHGVGRVSVDD